MAQQQLHETQPVAKFAEEAYLDYAMYVILDRALPHLGDGLKPVQRRIIYAMSELHLNYLAKYKKAARTIGDVLGKFHPHGEAACYEAMVLMAQPFASRYPLIEGQGNFGTADDPKSFAAMRYTEAKLSKYAEILLAEIAQGAVAWQDNFDGTLQEPKVLPAKLPMVLLNGTTGIAVGMATDLLPHNLQEVGAACKYILDHPDPAAITVEDLHKYILGPDFPTAAEIISSPAELLAIYKTGIGSVRARAVYKKESVGIVITALPYMVSGAKVLKQIAEQIHKKELQFITDLRDESDHQNPTRLVLVPRSNKVDLDLIMLHLFATTDLEKTYRVNFNLIGIDGKPKVKNLLEILTEWLEFRKTMVSLSLQHTLTKLQHRSHIVDGLLIIYLHLEEIIAVIRHAEDPKAELIAKFNLTEIQANAILELKLKNLAKLEELALQTEKRQLLAEQKELQAILSSARKLKAYISGQITEIVNKLQDPRMAKLVTRSAAKPLDQTSLGKTADLEVTIVLSDQGWVRCGKGQEVDPLSLNYRTGEQYKAHARGWLSNTAIFLDQLGTAYALNPATLPSMRGYGEPLTSKLAPAAGAKFIAVLMGNAKEQVFLIQTRGFGFVTTINNLQAKTKTGKKIVNLAKDTIIATY